MFAVTPFPCVYCVAEIGVGGITLFGSSAAVGQHHG